MKTATYIIEIQIVFALFAINLRQALSVGAPEYRSAAADGELGFWLREAADEAVEVLEDVEGASARVGVRLPHLHHDGAHAVGYLRDEMTVFIIIIMYISKANGYRAVPRTCPVLNLSGQHGNLALTCPI